MTTSHVSTAESTQLLAKYLGVDLDDLQQRELNLREQERIQKLEAQIEAEKARQRAEVDKAHRKFQDAWKDGSAVVRIDGKIIQKPKDICTSGTPNATEIDHLMVGLQRARSRVSNRGIDGVEGAWPAVCLTRAISCTCGKQHEIMIFIK